VAQVIEAVYWALICDHWAMFDQQQRPRPMKQRLLVLGLCLFAANALAQADCRPFAQGMPTIVPIGSLKSVAGALAEFDPCHKSVRLDMPAFGARKRGDKPPLVIVIHGGDGLGGYQREFAKLMNQNGFATLVFDAFEMNGFTAGSDLITYQVTNAARQRMLFKVTQGAYQWALGKDTVDTSRIFFQGQSNGGSIAINMAAAADPAHVKGVVAEAGPSTGIGFPDEVRVPLLMVYGSADVYGGTHAADFMHLRGNACSTNERDPLAPVGFAANCNRQVGRDNLMPSPQAWFEKIRSADNSRVRFELIEGGGHGMMFVDFSASERKLPGDKVFYQSRGASREQRQRLLRLILDFFETGT
jgi:dienelactone hydrolase